MTIQIQGNDVIENSRRGLFQKVNPGVYTTTQRDALSSKSIGDTIYNSTEEELQVWTGTEWSSVGGGQTAPPVDTEVIAFGDYGSAPDSVTGLLINLNKYTSIKIAGCGGGSGGGAAANVVGDSFPIPGLSIDKIWWSVAAGQGQDTYVQINGDQIDGRGGTDLIRFRGASGATGGPSADGGPNCVAGGNAGTPGQTTSAAGSNGQSVINGCGGCGGSGAGGREDPENENQPGGPGGTGGSCSIPSATNVIIRQGNGPNYAIPKQSNPGGGGSSDVPPSGWTGRGGYGGYGGGIPISNPARPTTSGEYGNGVGAITNPGAAGGQDGRGFIIIQLFA
jgi:hypothetical protein